MRAIILSIGDEILNGQTINTNAAWIGKELTLLSADILYQLSIADEQAEIKRELTKATSLADWVLITGGLGPTLDDITKKAVCDLYDVGLKFIPEVFEHVKGIFERRGREVKEVNRQQAFIPENASYLFNKRGTAPGMLIESGKSKVVFMPGVPYEMKYIMTKHVLPRIKEEQNQVIINRHYRTAGVAESDLAERLNGIEQRLEQVKMAYLPSPGEVKIRLTAKGSDSEDLNRRIDSLEEEMLPLLGKDLVCKGEESIAETLTLMLKERGESIAFAESCTGGKVCAEMISIPGASEIVQGGVVSYSNQIKMQELQVKPESLEKFGAVSEQVVKEMASGCREKFKVDYAISLSGIAGPDGGSDEKPVGTVWVGLASKHGVEAKKFQFFRNRELNLELSTKASLDYLRRKLKEE